MKQGIYVKGPVLELAKTYAKGVVKIAVHLGGDQVASVMAFGTKDGKVSKDGESLLALKVADTASYRVNVRTSKYGLSYVLADFGE